MSNHPEPNASAAQELARRSLLSRVCGWSMGGALVAAYGSAAALAGRYLFPARMPQRRWIFAAQHARLRRGEALAWRTPSGERISIARVGDGASAADFIALSSTCPHLGCQVRYEPQHTRFFCPCHNGAFAPDGRAISGPPADAGQNLVRYELRVEGPLLYVGLSERQIATSGAEA